MPNPIEILSASRRRIALVAAARTFCFALAPAVVTVVVALFAGSIGARLWSGFGYVLNPERAELARSLLLALAAIELAIGGVYAYLAWRGARDPIAAAEQVDRAVNAHQQIVTLATLADASEPEREGLRRSPLFPILWQRTMAMLGRFDPSEAFPLDLGRPLKRSSMLAVLLGAILVLSTLGLVEPPSPFMAEAEKLREIARDIEKSATTPGDLAMARDARAAADALQNPKLPPEQKLVDLRSIIHELNQQEKENAGQGAGASASASSSGEGQGQGTGEGKGNSKGGGNGGEGQGKGKGPGSGQSQQGQKGEKNNIELRNELAKAEAQVETHNGGSQNPTGPGEGKGEAPKPGQSGTGKSPGNFPDQNAAGSSHKPGAGEQNAPSMGGNQQSADQGSNQGDTHLGERPAPGSYQRYLKPGENGEGVGVRDARYVQFKIPGANPKPGGGGETVVDRNGPRASTPYVNVPLAPTRGDVEPDEQQLVPPRYRDLIQ